MRPVCQRRPAGSGRIAYRRTTILWPRRLAAMPDWVGDPARPGAAASRTARCARTCGIGRAHRRRRCRVPPARHRAGVRRPAPTRRDDAGCGSRGIRSTRRHHLLTQGLRSAHDAVPRPMPLLRLRRHPRSAAQEAQARIHVARAGARGRAAGPGDGMQRGPADARRPARGPLARGTRVARRARLRVDARLRGRDRPAHHRRDRDARASQPRGHDPRRARRAAADGAVDGHDARDDVTAPV